MPQRVSSWVCNISCNKKAPSLVGYKDKKSAGRLTNAPSCAILFIETGAAGQTVVPPRLQEVTAHGGNEAVTSFYFLLAWIYRLIMDTIKIPICIRSGYVTITVLLRLSDFCGAHNMRLQKPERCASDSSLLHPQDALRCRCPSFHQNGGGQRRAFRSGISRREEHTACRLSAAPLQIEYHNRQKMTSP